MKTEAPMKIMVPCACASECEYGVITCWEEPEKMQHPEWFLEWYTTTRHDAPFKERLKQAWKLLRGKHHWFHSIGISYESAQKLRDFLILTTPTDTTEEQGQ